MRGVTVASKADYWIHDISTHTPHARRDFQLFVETDRMLISTHTPHARRDSGCYGLAPRYYKFQLTRLMRGVTPYRYYCHLIECHFNSHASCEA